MSERTPETASLRLGRARRLGMYYLVFGMALLQLVFVLLTAGVDFDPAWMVWLAPGVVPVTLALWAVWTEGPEPARAEPAAAGAWLGVAAVLFTLWGGSYFLVGRLIDPARVRLLTAPFDARIPLLPAFSLIYILLYPIFLLPFFVLRERAAVRRLAICYLAMFATCSLIFVAVPIAFDRPALPPRPWDFGTWVLSLVWGSDPAWNCLPSEHCTAAMLAGLFVWEANRKLGVFALFTALFIGLSTLFTKQHYLVDVVTGYGLAFGIYGLARWAGREHAVGRTALSVMRSVFSMER